jgi:tRNA(Ile)-lysidine synthase
VTDPKHVSIAVALSGGGDSTALLAALRVTKPDLQIHALIVDHGLREASAQEAELAADTARSLGANPHILRWSAPRPSQGHARLARHRLLAKACERLGARILCLGHNRDDRIETLRMRAARDGEWQTMIGPGLYDPSPVWPEGRGLVLARPLLGYTRAELRAYLRQQKIDWIDDPSNENPRFERVRFRQCELGEDKAGALIGFSDAARQLDRRVRRSAYQAFKSIVEILPWGGVRIDGEALTDLASPVLRTLVSALLLGVSGRARLPRPDQVDAAITALTQGLSHSAGGVVLTPDRVMGRDRGGVEGRADGTKGIAPMRLNAGETSIFDGRWLIEAQSDITFGPANICDDALDVPTVFHSTLPMDTQSGLNLAAPGSAHLGQIELLLGERVRSVLLPPTVPLWFDALQTACCRPVALAQTAVGPNI